MSGNTWYEAPSKNFLSPYTNSIAPVYQGSETYASLQAMDLNGDGHEDLLAIGFIYPLEDRALPVRAFINDGAGNFVENTQNIFGSDLPSTVHARDYVYDDFNGDGVTDLFIADHGYDAEPFSGYKNTLILSSGSSSFTNASTSIPDTPDFSHSAASSDIDGDGDVDLFVSNLGSSSYFLINDGSGNFSQRYLDGIDSYTMVHMADVDNDQDNDLILAGFHGKHSIILKNDGSGNFGEEVVLPEVPSDFNGGYQLYSGPVGVVVKHADFNNDGRVDIFMNHQNPNQTGSYTQMLIQQQDGSFVNESHQRILLQPAAEDEVSQLINTDANFQGWMVDAYFEDMDGDGDIDIVSKFAGDLTPSLYLNNGDGYFSFKSEYVYRESEGDNLKHDNTQMTGSGIWTLVDANSDGKKDYAFIDPINITIQLNNFPEASKSPGTITGSGDHDAGSGAESFVGSSVLDNAQADERFEGGEGLDIVSFTSPRDQYQIAATDAGFEVRGLDGNDLLVGVERAHFGQQGVAFDLDGTGGQAYRLYKAAFDRAPDDAGLGYWINAMDNGMSLNTVSESFIASAEFQQRYGDLDNAAFIEAVYRNALDREPDSAGHAYWVASLDSGSNDRAGIMIGFSESEENQGAVSDQISQGISFDLWAG